MSTIKDKITSSYIDVSSPTWYLLRSDLKSFSVTSSGLSLIMISMLSLFQCIRNSSQLSLEEIKLIDIVSLVFHVSHFFRLLMISFKYDLILLKSNSHLSKKIICFNNSLPKNGEKLFYSS